MGEIINNLSLPLIYHVRYNCNSCVFFFLRIKGQINYSFQPTLLLLLFLLLHAPNLAKHSLNGQEFLLSIPDPLRFSHIQCAIYPGHLSPSRPCSSSSSSFSTFFHSTSLEVFTHTPFRTTFTHSGHCTFLPSITLCTVLGS